MYNGRQNNDRNYGEFFTHENATATVINEANAATLLHGIMSAGANSGFTFSAGSTGAITAWADAGDGEVTATSVGHSLTANDEISIDSTTNYNGVYKVASVTTDTFNIVATWVADDAAGNYVEGDVLTVGVKGAYAFAYAVSMTSAGNNKRYEFNLVKNGDLCTKCASERFLATGADLGSLGSGAIFEAEIGDKIAMSVTGLTDATNLTVRNFNLRIWRL